MRLCLPQCRVFSDPRAIVAQLCLWGSAPVNVIRKSCVAFASCHLQCALSSSNVFPMLHRICAMSLALSLLRSCPTEPAYSTSEQPRQSTLTNQTQPETRQPASPSARYVNHGAIASTSLIHAPYLSSLSAPIKVIRVRIIVLCSRHCPVRSESPFLHSQSLFPFYIAVWSCSHIPWSP